MAGCWAAVTLVEPLAPPIELDTYVVQSLAETTLLSVSVMLHPARPIPLLKSLSC